MTFNDQVQKLRNEAANAGDMEQVELCDRALAGDANAADECAEALSELRAADSGDYVEDPLGGRWWPAEEAALEISQADCPQARAIRLAQWSPMRGTWRS